MATKRKADEDIAGVEKKARIAATEVPPPVRAPGYAVVTKPAPNFENLIVVNPDKSFGKVSLSDYKGKYLVLFFYPLDFTFVCPTEIIAFSEAAAEFKKINCEILGVSCDSQFTHLAWLETPRTKGGLGQLNYPLVADLTRKLSEDYGVLLDDGHPLRGLFIIDGKGVLRYLSHNDPPVGRNVEEVLRLVQGYQFADKHGEVCPAGWKPGKATIRADPTGKLPFFEKEYQKN